MPNIWQKLKKPIWALAPMEDVTDTVFRQIVASVGKPSLFWTEFTSVDGLLSLGRLKVAQRLKFSQMEKPIIAQIWGSNPDHFYQAVKLISPLGFAGIDINMGCPQKVILKNDGGGALIKNPALASKIIQACRQGTKLPISVKTRLGYKTVDFEWLKFLLAQDIDALTVHGRVVAQMSKGQADWEAISQVVRLRDSLSKKILILGNGDILSYQDGLERIQKYKVDGVMIGRGIFKNPWIFNPQIDPAAVSSQERSRLLLKHLQLFNQTWEGQKNLNIMKKFIKVYISDFPGAFDLRLKLMAQGSYFKMINLLAP